MTLTLFAGSGRGVGSGEAFFDDGVGWGYREEDASLLAFRAAWDRKSVRLSVAEQWSGKGRPALKVDCVGLGSRTFETDMAV